MYKLFLILLICIIVFIGIIGKYPKEKYTNSDILYPESPNDLTCLNYVQRVKGWNIDELSEEQKRVLYTMRTLQTSQYSPNTKLFPFAGGCVIPRQHFPIFQKDINDRSALSVTPVTVVNGVPVPQRQITVPFTEVDHTPDGVYVDFSKMDFNQFKDFLNGAYRLYDEEFIKEKDVLVDQSTRLDGKIKVLESNLYDLKRQTETMRNRKQSLDNQSNNESENSCSYWASRRRELENQRNTLLQCN